MKGIGCAVIMFACLAFGFLYTRDKRRRIQSLRGLRDGLTLLMSELSVTRSPLPELVETCAHCTSSSAQHFFRCLAFGCADLGIRSFSELWEEAARICLTELTEQEQQELTSVGKLLGRAELSRQVAALESCRNLLDSALKTAEAQYRSEQKLGFGIPASLGAMLMILLL